MYSVVLMMAVTSGAETPDLGHRHGCCGCSGYVASCYGGSGCHGGHHHHGHRHSCHGGSSCYGGVSYGCYGSTYGASYGCYGSTYGATTACYGGTPYMPPAVKPEDVKKMPKPGGEDQSVAPAPAKLIVSLPADAKLTIDGVATSSTSEERVFESPTLPPGRDFHYTLRAEVMRDNKPIRVEQFVSVRAGQESRVTLALPQGVASK